MTVNHLVLSGTVCKAPIQKISPSGVPHCQFMLEHNSQQVEAGLGRQAWCYMPVVVSGQQLQPLTRSITVGNKVVIQGFISSHKGRNGLNKLVLHAEHIELIDSGD